MNSAVAAGGIGLLEREAELESLRGLIDAAAGGAGQVVIVEGPPGIGKTELIEATTSLAEDADLRALLARGSELEAEFALGVARQLFEPVVAALEPGERDELLSGAARLATPLVVGGPADADHQGPADLFPLIHALYWLCANLSASGPLLIAVDDAHWADPQSLRFLHYLSRRVEELPVVVAIAARSTSPEAPVELVEAIRAEAGEVVTIHPAPLSRTATRALVGQIFGADPEPEFAGACHEASGGNPFLLNELGASLAGDRVAPVAASSQEVREVRSEAISRQVLVRLAALGQHERAVARAMATVGADAPLRHIAELAHVAEDDALAAVDSLIEGRVLATGRPLRFLHPLVRSAIYTDLGDGRRAADHKRAARLLAAAHEPEERVATHLLQAEAMGDDWVVDSLRAAARKAMASGAPPQAMRYLRRALDEPPADRAEVLLELGAAAARAGDADARGLLRGALEEAVRPELRVLAVVELGQDLAGSGRTEEAATITKRTLATLDPERKELVRPLEMLLLVMAESSVFARRAAGDLIGRATRAIERRGYDVQRGLLAIVAFERATVSGTADEAGVLAEHALADGQLFTEQPVDSAHAYFATSALALADRPRDAERSLADAITENRQRGSVRGMAFASAMRALIRVQLGDLTGAEQDARSFLGLKPDWEVFRLAAVSALADVRIERGKLDAAAETLGEVSREVDHVLFLHVWASRARLALARREADTALAQLRRCAEWEAAWGVRNPVWCEWRLLAAMAQLANGDPDEAERLAGEQLSRVRSFGSRRALGNALRTVGLVAGGAEGIHLLEDSVEQLSRTESRLDHARSLFELGAALRRAKRRADCREPLREAIDLARRCGAIPLAERAHEELRATGARPRNLVLSGLESLTAREEQVARIAAEGLTNREIAQELFVSRKTVETHLGSIYRKLDVSSREEVAEVLAAHG